jgi:hypothetical protein
MEDSLLLLHQERATIQEAKFLDKPHASRLFRGHSFCIDIDLRECRLQSFICAPYPYIKIGNANNIGSSTYITRICLREPKVEYHEGRGCIVNDEFLNYLNQAMNYNSCYKAYNGTVLECINNFMEEQTRGYNALHKTNFVYEPIVSVDFTKVNNYYNRGMDKLLWKT